MIWKRALIALSVSVISAVLSWFAQVQLTRAGGDLLWAITAGSDLLAGRDPYGHPIGPHWSPYPLPAALVGIPFSLFPPAVGAALFFGISSGLLAYCLIKKESYVRLLIFISMPFWFALIWTQWSPLIMASAFIPVLLPIVLIKPQIALPVGLTHLTRVGVCCCLGVALLSLIIYPRWPLVWISQIREYQRFFPVATPIGPLLLIALLRWRDKDAQLFLLASLFPQRHFYDAFTLWLIPKTAKEIVLTAVFSWGAWFWKAYHPNMASSEVGLVSTLFFFLPMLCVILLRPKESGGEFRLGVLPVQKSKKASTQSTAA